MLGPGNMNSITSLIKYWLKDNDNWDTKEGAPTGGTIPLTSKGLHLFDNVLSGQNRLAYIELFGT